MHDLMVFPESLEAVLHNMIKQKDIKGIEHGDPLAFFAYLRTEEASLDVHLEACWAL